MKSVDEPMKSLLPERRTLAMIVVLGTMATAAEASFPGVNGKIVFWSGRDGIRQVYAMNRDGGGQTNLSDPMEQEFSPRFSPDGSRIAFMRGTGANAEIYVMNADGTGKTALTTNGFVDASPAWSADGSQIVFRSDRDTDLDSEIFVMNADGTGVTQLTFNTVADFDPSWSPDGTLIVFTSDRDDPGGFNNIYRMDADGSNQVALTDDPANDFAASWSPDGSQIVFTSNRTGNNEIYVMNADGSNEIALTNNPGIFNTAPTWSPDGNLIAFTSNRSGDFEIWVQEIMDPSTAVNLTNAPGSDFEPHWQAIAPSTAIQDLIGQVAALVPGTLTPFQGGLLALPLLAANAAVNAGNTQAAINALQVFNNLAQLYEAFNLLTPQEAQALVDEADAIMAFLGS